MPRHRRASQVLGTDSATVVARPTTRWPATRRRTTTRPLTTARRASAARQPTAAARRPHYSPPHSAMRPNGCDDANDRADGSDGPKQNAKPDEKPSSEARPMTRLPPQRDGDHTGNREDADNNQLAPAARAERSKDITALPSAAQPTSTANTVE